jgi:hypothetical protein
VSTIALEKEAAGLNSCLLLLLLLLLLPGHVC